MLMQTNYKVSNLETRLYLNNKLLALEKQMEVIRAAISLFEEAEEEIVKHGNLRVIPPVISEEAKIIVPVKLPAAALKHQIENPNVVLEAVKEIKLTVMSTDDFLINLKRIRRNRGLSIAEVAEAHNLTVKELEALESGESRGLKLLIQSLATFYDFHLNDIDEKFKGSSGHYIGELPLNKTELAITEPINLKPASSGSEMISQAEFFASLKDLRIINNKTQKELGLLIGIGNKGYSVFERNCTKVAADTIGPVWKKYGKILANHFGIQVSGFDPIQPLNKYAGMVKTVITPTGKIKKVFTRTELGTNTNGKKIKRIYKKREPKTKPIDEDV